MRKVKEMERVQPLIFPSICKKITSRFQLIEPRGQKTHKRKCKDRSCLGCSRKQAEYRKKIFSKKKGFFGKKDRFKRKYN